MEENKRALVLDWTQDGAQSCPCCLRGVTTTLRWFSFSVNFSCLLHLKLPCARSGKGVSPGWTWAEHPFLFGRELGAFLKQNSVVFLKPVCVEQRRIAHWVREKAFSMSKNFIQKELPSAARCGTLGLSVGLSTFLSVEWFAVKRGPFLVTIKTQNCASPWECCCFCFDDGLFSPRNREGETTFFPAWTAHQALPTVIQSYRIICRYFLLRGIRFSFFFSVEEMICLSLNPRLRLAARTDIGSTLAVLHIWYIWCCPQVG